MNWALLESYYSHCRLQSWLQSFGGPYQKRGNHNVWMGGGVVIGDKYFMSLSCLGNKFTEAGIILRTINCSRAFRETFIWRPEAKCSPDPPASPSRKIWLAGPHTNRCMVPPGEPLDVDVWCKTRARPRKRGRWGLEDLREVGNTHVSLPYRHPQPPSPDFCLFFYSDICLR